MGHALAPYLFHRFANVLDEVNLALNIDGIAYLDDWLLHSASPEDLQSALDMIKAMGITINSSKSVLCTTLQYLGFKINSIDLTIKLTLSAFDRLIHVLRYTKNGSILDRQRIRSYATWILYNLRLPIFLSSDILLEDSSWILFDNSSVEMNGQIQVTLYTDATPHSVVAVIPTLRMSFVQAFYIPEEINRAEAIAVLCLGLQWAASGFQECHFSVWFDNAAVVATLTIGTGAL